MNLNWRKKDPKAASNPERTFLYKFSAATRLTVRIRQTGLLCDFVSPGVFSDSLIYNAVCPGQYRAAQRWMEPPEPAA